MITSFETRNRSAREEMENEMYDEIFTENRDRIMNNFDEFSELVDQMVQDKEPRIIKILFEMMNNIGYDSEQVCRNTSVAIRSAALKLATERTNEQIREAEKDALDIMVAW